VGDVIKLVPPKPCQDTIDTLVALLADARAGNLVGLTYVALYTGRRFSADVIGSALEAPVFALGPLRCLSDYLVTLASDNKK
jgi:hypothetical protein